jgi:hypothetical protein
MDAKRGRLFMIEKSITTQTGPMNGRIDLLVADGDVHKLERPLFVLAHCLLSSDFSMAGRLFNDPMYRLERKKRETPLPVEARSASGSSTRPAG